MRTRGRVPIVGYAYVSDMHVLLLLSLLLAAPRPAATAEIPVLEVADDRVEFRLRNDTGASVRVHTGSGTTTITNGSATRFQADVGQEFHLAPDGTPDQFLFEVADEMDGTTLDLSEYV